MVYKVYSGRVGGVFGDLITVEVDASSGLPGFEMIGLPGSEVKEAKDRVKVALKNIGINIPAMKVVINLSPADEHKAGAAFDLPIAVAILGVFGHISSFSPEESIILGELSLDGKLKGVRGVLPIVKMAKEMGFKNVILPKENAAEAGMIKDINIVPLSELSEAVMYLNADERMKNVVIPPYVRQEVKLEDAKEFEEDFSDVYGQENVKRAAALAAAGFHHLLMIGPPGTGKSLVAKRIPGIMPRLSYEESLEISTIFSVAGQLSEEIPFIKERPFFSPHHGASSQAIVGGGPYARPGLVSLSHKGILFLDEMAEFKRETLDMLRQPLEDGKITVSRAKNTFTYPAGFMLVGAMNPCPCGYFPDRNRCFCSRPSIERYLSKISGPILDRIDICVEVPRIEAKELKNLEEMKRLGMVGEEKSDYMTGENAFTTEKNTLSSAELRERVESAVKIQQKRYRDEKFCFNSQIPGGKVSSFVPLKKEANDFAFYMYESMNLSMRSFYKLIRVARTIADFEGDTDVEVKHLAEAACYRFPDYMGGDNNNGQF